MKRSNSFSTILAALLLFAATSVFTSCNRGYGCPNKISVKESKESVAPTYARSAETATLKIEK